MDENDLRAAMRTTLTIEPGPPPMDSAAAVRTGRRAVRRRMAVAGAGATAVLIAVASATAGPGLHLLSGGGTPGSAGQPSAMPDPDDTKPAWPVDGDGKPQEDATAKAGLHYERGETLLGALVAAVPKGYTALISPRDHQGAVERDQSWSYSAVTAVTRDGRTGHLNAEVHTRDNHLPTEACALARSLWGLGGQCQVETVGGLQVGVVVKPGADDRLDQWAAYRHPDGMVVFVGQARGPGAGTTKPRPLAKLPFTVPQLAALAVDGSFHLK